MVHLFALVLLGMGHAPAQDKTYLLAFNPPLNKALHYDIQVDVAGPSPANLKISKSAKATKARAGIFTVVTTFDTVSFGTDTSDQAGQAERLIKSTVVTQTINSQGGIVSSDASRSISQMMIGGLDAVNAFALSPSPVKVGETWHNTIDNNGAKLEVELKLASVGSEHGKQVAHLKMGVVTSPAAEPPLPLALDVDLATGTLQHLDFAASMASGDAKGSSIHVTIRLK